MTDKPWQQDWTNVDLSSQPASPASPVEPWNLGHNTSPALNANQQPTSFDDLVPHANGGAAPMVFDDLVPRVTAPAKNPGVDVKRSAPAEAQHDDSWRTFGGAFGALENAAGKVQHYVDRAIFGPGGERVGDQVRFGITHGLAQSQEATANTYGHVTEDILGLPNRRGALREYVPEALRPEQTTQEDIDKAMDFAHDDAGTLALKAIKDAAAGAPSLALMAAGGGAGGLLGMSGGAGLGTLFESLGPNLDRAARKYPNDPEKARKEALQRTLIQTGGSEVSAGLFGITGNPLGAVAPKYFENYLTDLALQAVYTQPLAAVATDEIANLASGDPTIKSLSDFGNRYLEQLGPSVAMTAGFHAFDVLAGHRKPGGEAIEPPHVTPPNAPSDAVADTLKQMGIHRLGDLMQPLTEPTDVRTNPAVVKDFITASGSHYTVDGENTQRNRAVHEGDQPGDEGMQPKSERTIYVDAATAERLRDTGNMFRLFVGDQGRLTLMRPHEGGWGVNDQDRGMRVARDPGIGLHPVELWDADASVPREDANGQVFTQLHVGSEITHVRDDGARPEPLPQAPVQPDEPPLAQDHTRLYRADPLPWSAETGVPEHRADADGEHRQFATNQQRFTSDRQAAQAALDHNFPSGGGHLTHVDVPNDQLGKHRLPEAEHDYSVPAALRQERKALHPVDLTAADVAKQLKLRDVDPAEHNTNEMAERANAGDPVGNQLRRTPLTPKELRKHGKMVRAILKAVRQVAGHDTKVEFYETLGVDPARGDPIDGFYDAAEGKDIIALALDRPGIVSTGRHEGGGHRVWRRMSNQQRMLVREWALQPEWFMTQSGPRRMTPMEFYGIDRKYSRANAETKFEEVWAHTLEDFRRGAHKIGQGPMHAILAHVDYALRALKSRLYQIFGVKPNIDDLLMLADRGVLSRQPMNTFGPDVKFSLADRDDSGKISSWHGTRNRFDPEPGAPLGRFREDKRLSGEGSNAILPGTYTGEAFDTARWYRDQLAGFTTTYNGKEVPRIGSAADIEKELGVDHTEAQALYWVRQESDLDKAVARWRQVADREEAKGVVPAMVSALRKRAAWVEANKDKITIKTNGHIYEVHVDARAEHMIDWDHRLDRQSALALKGLKPLIDKIINRPEADQAVVQKILDGSVTGQHVIEWAKKIMGDTAVADALRDAGVRGVQFYDQHSREKFTRVERDINGTRTQIKQLTDRLAWLERDVDSHMGDPDVAPVYFDRRAKEIAELRKDGEALHGRLRGLYSGEGLTRNYVIFDPRHTEITKRFAVRDDEGDNDNRPSLRQRLKGVGDVFSRGPEMTPPPYVGEMHRQKADNKNTDPAFAAALRDYEKLIKRSSIPGDTSGNSSYEQILQRQNIAVAKERLEAARSRENKARESGDMAAYGRYKKEREQLQSDLRKQFDNLQRRFAIRDWFGRGEREEDGPSLEAFAAGSAQSAWLGEKGMKVYVRRTSMRVGGAIHRMLEIPNVQSTTTGNGAFSALLSRATALPHFDGIYVENVVTQRFADGLKRRGFVQDRDRIGFGGEPSFYKLHKGTPDNGPVTQSDVETALARYRHLEIEARPKVDEALRISREIEEKAEEESAKAAAKGKDWDMPDDMQRRYSEANDMLMAAKAPVNDAFAEAQRLGSALRDNPRYKLSDDHDWSVKLFSPPFPIRRGATVEEIGKHLQSLSRDTNRGKPRDPALPKDWKFGLETALAEIKDQLGEDTTGENWYDHDIAESMRLATHIVPEIGYSEPHRVLLTQVAAILSYKIPAHKNFGFAIDVLEHFTKSGELPTLQPGSGAKWGPASRTQEFQLDILNRMIREKGLYNTAEWLLTHHTVKEMNEHRGRYGYSEQSKIAGKMSDRLPGSYLFGEKAGPFMRNLNGLHDTTVDSWFVRGWDRIFGLHSTRNADPAPTSTSERARMKAFTKQVAERLGKSEQATQALMWYYEQRLYRMLGGDNKPTSFSDGARRALEQRGITDGGGAAGRGDAAEIAAQQRAAGGPAPSDIKFAIGDAFASGAGEDRTAEGAVRDRGAVLGGTRWLSESDRALGETTPLEGLPAKATIPGIGAVDVGPFRVARNVAREYMRAAGLPFNPSTRYAKVNPARAVRIADAFESMKHQPDDPLVAAAYAKMLEETMAQWDHVKKTGLKVEFIDLAKGDPYRASPRMAIEDVKNNNHLWVFATVDGYGEGIKPEDLAQNPMLAATTETISGKPVLKNDIFRIVHDYFGHVKEGTGFRHDGEENAWRSHGAMYSPLARMAITTETRGQNSWLNFGPHGEKNRTASTEETVFAEQKIGILPDWVMHEGAEDFLQPVNQEGIRALLEQGIVPEQLTASRSVQDQGFKRFKIEEDDEFKQVPFEEHEYPPGRVHVDDGTGMDDPPLHLDDFDRAIGYLQSRGYANPEKEWGFVNLNDYIHLAQKMSEEAATQSHLRRTETWAFKQFFRASKVLDAKGNPAVMAHATVHEFDFFARRTNWTGTDETDIGMHFGSPAVANERIQNTSWNARFDPGSRILPVYLRIENPFRLPDLGDWELNSIHEAAGRFENLEFGAEVLNARNLEEARKAFEARGYDGIVYKNQFEVPNGVEEDSYIIFRPEQAKSIFNRGTWEPRTPLLRYALREDPRDGGPMFKRWFRESVITKPDGKPRLVYPEQSGVRELPGHRPGMTFADWLAADTGENRTFGEARDLWEEHSPDESTGVWFSNKPVGIIAPHFLRLENPYYPKKVELDRIAASPNPKLVLNGIKQQAQKLGYDGFIMPDGRMAVFRGEQIKPLWTKNLHEQVNPDAKKMAIRDAEVPVTLSDDPKDASKFFDLDEAALKTFGFRMFTLMDGERPVGGIVGHMQGETFHVVSAEAYKLGGPNALGTKTLRQLGRQLAEFVPDAKKITGLRVSGARGENHSMMTEELRKFAVRDEHDDMNRKFSIAGASRYRVPYNLGRIPRDIFNHLTTMIPDKIRENFDQIWEDTKMAFVPISAGKGILADKARAIAWDAANTLRASDKHGAMQIENIEARFTAREQEEAWTAADEESVALETGRPTTLGLDSLTNPELRAVVEQGIKQRETIGRALVNAGRMVGILPGSVPRVIMQLGREMTPFPNTAPRAPGERGGNLIVDHGSMKRRRWLFAEDTESAARRKPSLGNDATLVRNIKTLFWTNAMQRRVLAAVTMMDRFAAAGKAVGEDYVAEGKQPMDGHEWWTIDGHPAFTKYEGRMRTDDNGKQVPAMDENGRQIIDRVPLYLRGEFRGPVEAILKERTPAFFQHILNFKGRVMHAIMYSGLIHLQVEFGRALPIMPGKIFTTQFWRDGYRYKNDPVVLQHFIMHGLDPNVMHGYLPSLADIVNMPQLTAGRSWTSQVVSAPFRLWSPDAELSAKQWVDWAGRHWHQTLLWDRIADLQMGLAVNMRQKYLAKGFSDAAATTMAAHIANRFAGILPKESMSHWARIAANFAMFSRSFTLGNLGVFKDLVAGLPKHIQAKLTESVGAEEMMRANATIQRKAFSAVTYDILLMYGTLSFFQSMINIMHNTLSNPDKDKDLLGKLGAAGYDEGARYMERIRNLLNLFYEDPIEAISSPFADAESLMSTAENEPGKQFRLRVGTNQEGRDIYMRFAVGKLGEEFRGWTHNPSQMIWNKASTFLKPFVQTITNDKGFGRHVYNPYAKSTAENLKASAQVAFFFAGSQLPTDSIEAGLNIVSGGAYTGEAPDTMDYLKVFGPLLGFTFGEGAPAGPRMGEIYQAGDEYRQHLMEVMPHVNVLVHRGDLKGAVDQLQAIGADQKEIKRLIAIALNPEARITKGGMRHFYMRATPAEKAAMARAQGAANARASAAAAEAAGQD